MDTRTSGVGVGVGVGDGGGVRVGSGLGVRVLDGVSVGPSVKPGPLHPTRLMAIHRIMAIWNFRI
ncbi:MAG TPA: hypothetical protein DIS70_00815 [Anaerolineae bacterium]|nr:hypothetical protein [Anaerolineae bacterium]